MAELATYLKLFVAVLVLGHPDLSGASGLLGETAIDVMTRISGILVAAMAVGLLPEGLLDLFPKLAG